MTGHNHQIVKSADKNAAGFFGIRQGGGLRLVVKPAFDNHFHPVSLNGFQFIAGYDFGHINAAGDIEASCCKPHSLGVVSSRTGNDPK